MSEPDKQDQVYCLVMIYCTSSHVVGVRCASFSIAAGVMVLEGKLQKGATISVKRGKVVVYEGLVSSLRRIKDTVDEVTSGLECGLGSDGFLEWQVLTDDRWPKAFLSMRYFGIGIRKLYGSLFI